MEDFWAHSQDATSAVRVTNVIAEPMDSGHTDDPLGDEAASPMTWQHLAGADGAWD